MRGRDDQGVGREPVQRLGLQAVAPDGNGHELDPMRLGDRPRVVVGGRVLNGQAPRAAGGEHLDHEPDPLSVAGRDDDVLGRRRGAADAVQVRGERDAQLEHAVAVEIAEAVAGGLREHPADRAQPRGARERGHVGAAVAEVDDGRRFRRQRERGPQRRRRRATMPSAARATRV